MNLENQLKHYLPYNLKCEILDYKSDYVGDQYDTLKGYYLLNDKAYFNFKSGRDYAGKNTTQFKPILRPLSEFGDSDDTRKVHEFIGLGKWCDNYTEYFNTWFDDLANIDKLILQAPKEVFDYFLANHFDVFNLLKHGMAIDVNDVSLAEC
jgi:hypothetical protein